MFMRPTRCPACGDRLLVSKLFCPTCDTTIEGRYAVSRLEQLSAEQLAFVELFLRCDGKLNWAAQELKVSYPTVRGRLDDVIRALGYEPLQEAPDEERQRQEARRQAVLDELAGHKIDTTEAIRRLKVEG